MKKPKLEVKPIPVPDVTYIVSAYNRPLMLPVCLWSIRGQTHQNFELIVTDNAIDNGIAAQHEAAVKAMHDPRFRYVRTADKIKVSDCYYAAEWAIANMARGTWLCFPCDDTYLMPEFASRLLAAAFQHGWEFVYCKQVVVGPVASGGAGYYLWNMDLVRMMTLKTSFLIRTTSFPGFAAKPNESLPAAADYYLGMQMQARGAKIGSVDQIMVVHN